MADKDTTDVTNVMDMTEAMPRHRDTIPIDIPHMPDVIDATERVQANDLAAAIDAAHALRDAIVRDPDDVDAYLVYADALQTRGNRRGDLIAVQAELLQHEILRETEEALLEEFVAPLREHLIDGAVDIDWRLGFIHRLRCTLGKSPVDDIIRSVRAILLDESARLLQEVEVVVPLLPDPVHEPLLDVLLDQCPPTFCALTLSRPDMVAARTLTGHVVSQLGRVGRLFTAAPLGPGLRRLTLIGQFELGELPGETADRPGSVRALTLGGYLDPQALCERLLAARWLSSIESLTLRDLGEADVDYLIANGERLARLGKLDLRAVRLTDAQRHALRELSVPVAMSEPVVSAPARERPDTDDDMRCSFCQKPQREVRQLVSGPQVFICDECVALCSDIINAG